MKFLFLIFLFSVTTQAGVNKDKCNNEIFAGKTFDTIWVTESMTADYYFKIGTTSFQSYGFGDYLTGLEKTYSMERNNFDDYIAGQDEQWPEDVQLVVYRGLEYQNGRSFVLNAVWNGEHWKTHKVSQTYSCKLRANVNHEGMVNAYSQLIVNVIDNEVKTEIHMIDEAWGPLILIHRK